MKASSNISSKTKYIETVSTLIPVFGEDESRQLGKILFEDMGIAFEKIMIDEIITIDDVVLSRLDEQIDQLKKQVPIQYVLGKAHFFGRDFIVNPSVLIPRQETEELVNEIIKENKSQGLEILDIGSGSGCIGITLGLNVPQSQITALDVDEPALALTLKNARKHGIEIKYLLEDILAIDQLPGQYDIIVSNPPYVTCLEQDQMKANVLDHEPHLALFVPNKDPLRFYKKIIALAKKHLKPKGKLYFEINEKFGKEMILLCESYQCSCVYLLHDLNGKDRIIMTMFD